ncbi:MAG: protein translocase subunit SecD [bacterium]
MFWRGNWRIWVTLVVILVAIAFILPTLGFYERFGTTTITVKPDTTLDDIIRDHLINRDAAQRFLSYNKLDELKPGTYRIPGDISKDPNWVYRIYRSLPEPLKRNINLGLDLRGGVYLLLEVDASKIEGSVSDATARALEVVRNRVDALGVAEPIIQMQGDRWIVVQLAGLSDVDRARSIIQAAAVLEFKLVDETGIANKVLEKAREMNIESLNLLKPDGTIRDELKDALPEGYEVVYRYSKDESGKYVKQEPMVVRAKAELTGDTLARASVAYDQRLLGQPYVSLEFKPAAAKTFEEVTRANVGKRLAIILDGKLQSAPVIRDAIPSGRAVIEGMFTPQEASDLALVLNAGSLPAPVNIIESRVVGPSLGQDSINRGIRAILIGGIAVLIFMAIYYAISGIVADFALFLNLIILLAFMVSVRATLTLPGMAGIALTLGMAVDANVLILERIKEELKGGKTIRSAIENGYSRALLTIFDSNLTTLITALVLFQFGTGPVRGFAVTLSAGITISMFTAIFVTRLIYDLALERWEVKKLSISIFDLLRNTKIRFIEKRKVAFAISGALIIAGIVSLVAHGGPNLGIEFSGGTLMQVRFEKPAAIQDVREALARNGIRGASLQRFVGSSDFMIRVRDEDAASRVVEALDKEFARSEASSNPYIIVHREFVGATVGKYLFNQTMLAALVSFVLIILYVAWRFKGVDYGVAGVLALIHDVLITVGIFSILNREITIPVVAALLTLAGYSINDTIVIYDRIREEAKKLGRLPLGEIMNVSINGTLSRTVITGSTTLMVVVALYFLGGEVINDFSLALFIGIIVGTYSSIFIASPLVYIWETRPARHRGRKRIKAKVPAKSV